MRDWRNRIGPRKITVGDREVSDTIEAQTALILVNSTLFVFKPGPRNYDRTWIKDGSAQALALLLRRFDRRGQALRRSVLQTHLRERHGAADPTLTARSTAVTAAISTSDAQGEFVGIEEFRPFSRVLRLKSPAGLSPQNSVSRTKRWIG